MSQLNSVQLISFAVNGEGGNDASCYPAISTDNLFVLFTSYATNLLPDITKNRIADVLVRNTRTGEIINASTTSAGIEANGSCWFPCISSDNRYVAFQSYADNLIAKDVNSRVADIFIKDLTTGETRILSTSTDGVQGNANSWNPVLSANGDAVVFRSAATNLVDNDTNGVADVFVKFIKTGITVKASTDSAGHNGNGASWDANISNNGSIVCFSTMANNLGKLDTNNSSDIIIKSLVSGEAKIVSTSSAGVQGNNTSIDSEISGNGRFVVYSSIATNLIDKDYNNASDIFVKDLLTDVTTLVSSSKNDVIGNADSFHSSISEDGRFIAFESRSSNFSTDDVDDKFDIFVKDMLTGEIIEIVSPLIDDKNLSNYEAYISADGTIVAFETSQTYLAHGDRVFGEDIFTATLSWSASSVTGGAVADTLVGTSFADTIAGFAGADSLAGDWGDDTVRGGNDGDTITGNEGDDALFGDAGDDRVSGDDGEDSLYGGVGADSLHGGSGDDAAFGDGGDDAVEGADGDDTASGGAGNDSMTGGAGADSLFGGNGADTLVGDDGSDELRGGGGVDLLTGGTGADRFIFASLSGSVAGGVGDTITDFLAGTDKIVLSAFGTDGVFIGSDEFSGQGRLEVRFDETAGQLQVDVDGDGAFDAGDISVNGLSGVTARDILFL